MAGLKKIVACVLATFVFLQAGVLQTAATSLTGHSGNSNVVQIQADGKGSDFMRTFPRYLTLGDGIAENPMEQMTASTSSFYSDVPKYYQLFYDDILYGEGTVETHGSSITSLAMIATFLTGYGYKPNVLSRWFAGKADDDVTRLTYASNALGLSFEASADWNVVWEALQEGKLILVKMDKVSVFAQDVHYIVLKGLTAEGKILINDPCFDNVTSEKLKEKYETGFDESDICENFSCAWIYEQNDTSEYISCYTDTPVSDGTRYDSLSLTPAEKQLLARVVCVNAYGECEEGQQMMVEVILNRLLSDEYPERLKDVVFGENPLCDVTLLNEAELTQSDYLAVERALRGPYQLETSVTEFTYICHK